MENSIKTKDKRGGPRDGSGAKLKYGERTTTIAFRIPVSQKSAIKILVKEMMKKLEKPVKKIRQ
jgi:cation transport regulator ChaC